jgi:hypothetical protein
MINKISTLKNVITVAQHGHRYDTQRSPRQEPFEE